MSAARLIFSTGSLYTHDIAYCYEIAAEAGCDGMEVMCDERWCTRDPSYLKKLGHTYGLPTLVLHTPFSVHLMGWQNRGDHLGRIHQTHKLAEDIGAETIVIHNPPSIYRSALETPSRRYWLPWKTPFKSVKNWIENELPACQKTTPIKIAVENVPTVKIMGLKTDPHYWKGIEQWANLNEYLTLDTTHWATHDVKPLEAYEGAKGRVWHVHLSNYKDGREHRLPHQGELDLAGFLQRLSKDNFAGTVCLELYPDSLGFQNDATIRQNLKDSVAFCRQHLN